MCVSTMYLKSHLGIKINVKPSHLMKDIKINLKILNLSKLSKILPINLIKLLVSIA